jgi:membrane fusion protein
MRGTIDMEETAARPLFRTRAVQFRVGRMASGSVLRPPPSLAVFTVAIVVAVVAMGACLGTQTYARKATVTGYLAPPHGVVRVTPPRPGIVVSVAVAEGDVVQAGDPLLRVQIGRTSIAGADLDATMRQALLQQRDQHLNEIAFQEATARSEAQRLSERIGQAVAERTALTQQIQSQHDRAGLAREQAEVSRDLAAKGYVSAVEQRRREDARISQMQTLDTLRQQLAAKDGELVELRYALSQLPGRTSDGIARLRGAVAEIDSRLAEAEYQRAYLIVAPAAGRVSSVLATVGNAADPAQPLLSIVPQNEDLQAVLLVPERAIGSAAPGQPVRLSLEAFPFERFGARDGTITSIAHTPLRPEQAGGMPALHEPVYRVTVALRSQTIQAYGRDIPLQADMQVRANIIFDRRSFIQWLLDPILSARREA